MALAHVIENKVEAAYRRGDLFAKRARMMQEWVEFVTRAPATVTTHPAAGDRNEGQVTPSLR